MAAPVDAEPPTTTGSRRSRPAGTPDPPWFHRAVLGAVVVGIAMRLVLALIVIEPEQIPGDARYFRHTAASLAAGDGYSHPAPGGGPPAPSAAHPPAFPAVLAVGARAGVDDVDGQRILVSVVGSLGIVVVGLVGRRVAGAGAGVAAAGVAAVHPLWTQPSALLMSEALHLVVVPAILWLALAALDRPAWWRFGLLGATIGVDALTRSEAVALLVLLGLPVAVLAVRGPRARLGAAALVLVGGALVVGPWVARNAAVYGRPLLSTNAGVTLAGANCPATYAGDLLGSFDLRCAYGAAGAVLAEDPPGGSWDEGELDRELTRAGIEHARENLDRLPVVALARAARVWSLLDPAHSVEKELREGREPAFQWAGQILDWVLLPLAVTGGVVLARAGRRRELLVLVATPVLVTVTGVAVYGGARVRAGAEPALLLLAVVAVAAWWVRRRDAAGTGG